MDDVRLIDGNALVKQIEGTHCKDCNNYNGVMCRACEWMDAMDYIEDAPTIDAQPVKRAEWVDIGNSQGLKCSNCGRKASYHNGTRCYESYMAFCPGCGYDMRGEADEEK